MKINLGQFRRFEKQIILKNIGLAGQKKIFAANVLIVCAGVAGLQALSTVNRLGALVFSRDVRLA